MLDCNKICDSNASETLVLKESVTKRKLLITEGKTLIRTLGPTNDTDGTVHGA